MSARRASPSLKAYAKCDRAIESELSKREITLTMGGEPTFVPSQAEGSEWSVEAMGPQKLGYARRMAAAMIANTLPGSLAMQVFGKWYPGEQLPRWNFLVLKSNDGVPLWPDTHYLHLTDDDPHSKRRQALKRVANSIASALGLSSYLQPAFEQGDAPSQRPKAWVLPLAVVDEQWVSQTWQFPHADRVELLLGDSPAGLRIPFYQLSSDSLKCALTIEHLHGNLAIFIPPLEWPHFRRLVDILARVAQTCGAHNWVFCGYGPLSAGDNLTVYGLAADPGVLEVNLPPCPNWRAYVNSIHSVYAAAEKVDLVATKRHLNGVVRGTGGGAHLAFGGKTDAANPFLANPGWIASILRYWQHHPALSYAFTGQYVGPGSQAPRVDEGPMHGLYELEVACEGLQRLPPLADGQLVDQFLRNLLTDSAGNTHRAELCFDKFANPLTANGKLGIIELRAFETHPQPQAMSAVALFVRAILVRLLIKPFAKTLRRWGPSLHDHYFLPTLLWQDIETICAELHAVGLPFNSAWLKPAFDFRFPELGTLPVDGGTFRLRQALESWPLMAEESRGTSTVRVVDNSTDRLEITWSGDTKRPKGTLLVNGIALDWKPVQGTLIRGIRYKCASAYPALHPHVEIQSPLRFEWIPEGNETVGQAAYYHFWNPHQAAYENPPTSFAEAKRRCKERWQILTPANATLPSAIQRGNKAPEFNLTLDLRRA